MTNSYTQVEDLPAMLNAKILKEFMGISNGTVHALLNSKGFPTLRINKRKLVPRDAFLRWMDANTGNHSDDVGR